jgi:hypothetical protein
VRNLILPTLFLGLDPFANGEVILVGLCVVGAVWLFLLALKQPNPSHSLYLNVSPAHQMYQPSRRRMNSRMSLRPATEGDIAHAQKLGEVFLVQV